MTNSSYIWPDCFNDGLRVEAKYRPGERKKTRLGMAIADQLTAWALCSCDGENMPKEFGHTMAMLSRITGAAGPDAVTEASSKYLAAKS